MNVEENGTIRNAYKYNVCANTFYFHIYGAFYVNIYLLFSQNFIRTKEQDRIEYGNH